MYINRLLNLLYNIWAIHKIHHPTSPILNKLNLKFLVTILDLSLLVKC